MSRRVLLSGLVADSARLRSTEEVLERAQALASLGLWRYDVVARRTELSASLRQMVGLPCEAELGAEALWAVVHPEDRATMRAAIRTCATAGLEIDHALRLVRVDGSVRWVRAVALAVRDERGLVRELLGIVQDVTEPRSLAARLRRTSLALSQTGRLAHIGGLVINATNRTVEMSVELARLLDTAIDDLDQLLRLFLPPFREVLAAAIARAATDGGGSWDFEAAIELSSGRRLWVRTLGEPGGIPGEVRAAVQDISESRVAREEREILFELSPDLLLVCDRAARVRRMNPAFERLVGRSEAELVGSVAFDLIAPEDRWLGERALAGLLASPEIQELEANMLGPHGTRRLVSWRCAIRGELTFAVGRDVTVEREREEANRALALVAEHTNDAILLLDAAGRIRWVNAAFGRITGRSSAEAIGEVAARLLGVLPRSAPIPPEAGAGDRGGCWLARADGRSVWIEVEALPVAVAAGGVDAIWVVREATAQRLAEQALRTSEERFRVLADAAPVMIWLTDPDGRSIAVNREVLSFKGRSQEEELGDGWLHGIHPLDRPKVEEVFSAAIAERRPYEMEYRLRRADGAYRWVHDRGYPRLQADGSCLGFVGVTTDITERREAGIREWEASFDAVDSLMLVTSSSGRVERVNRAARRELGDGVLGRMIGASTDEPWRMVAGLIADPVTRWRAAAGEVRDAQGRSWQVEVSPHSGASHFVVLARDVSAMVALQEGLVRHERLAAMGEIVAGVAHEVRNPLFAMSAGVDALEAELPGELGEFAAMFRREIDRLSRLMGNLLDFGRASHGNRSASSLGPLVASAVELCRSLLVERGVDVVIDVAPTEPALLLDTPRVEILVRNLVDNAVRHSPPGSCVEVKVASWRAGDGQAGVELVVLDRGPGFVAADLPRLGQPFFTRRRGGTGLGLAIASRVVSEHGGEISFENRPDGGGRVRVRLPGRRD